MSICVLGSNSFAGSSFIDYLLNYEYEVIGISRSKEPDPVLLAHANNLNKKNFSFYRYDLNQHHIEIFRLISEKKSHVIVDFAGQGMVSESWQAPEQWYQTNVVAKSRLHHYLLQCDFLEKYIRVSTPEVYGSTTGVVDENHAFNPSTPYAVSHAAVDMNLKAYHQQYQFPMVLTRFANFYGPHQQLYRIIPRTIICGLIGEKLSLHGGGISERAFIYGDDVASALHAVMEKGRIGETYHFSSEKPTSIANVVKKISDQLAINFDNLATVGPERPGKDALYHMKTEKSEKELNWYPSISLDQGIKKTIDWVRNDIDRIKTLPMNYIHQS